MIKGMTGFGSAQFSSTQTKGSVEIKSWNHRYLDVSYFLPPGFSSLENKIKDLFSGKLERGKVSIALRLVQKPAAEIFFNKAAAKKHLNFARQLQKELHIKSDITVSEILKLPGVLEVKESQSSPEQLWPAIEVSVKKALRELVAMRAREGKALSVDVLEKASLMQLRVKSIEKRAAELLKDARKRLTNEEFQSFQKSSDVNEEIARLKHYILEAKALIKGTISAGKRLDFIAQEMQRETNTIGSKLQDKLVSNAVIALKSKIEKIREQSQNIE